MADDDDDEERELRKVALKAQADYYQLKTAKLADDIVKQEERRETVERVATVAKNVGKGGIKTAAIGFGLLVAVFVYILIESEKKSAVQKVDADRQWSRAQTMCRDGTNNGAVLAISMAGTEVWTSPAQLQRGQVYQTCDDIIANKSNYRTH